MGGFTAEELLDGGKILKCLRGDDPIPFFVGPFTKIDERPGSAHFTAEGAVVYILDRTLPYRLPMKERIQNKDSFAFWWKQLDYVFGLPDPRAFPPLDHSLAQAELNAVTRFAETAGDLAESSMLNALDRGFSARKDDTTGEEIVKTAFGPKDAQVGMSALLRHCNSNAVKDGARYVWVDEILKTACSHTADSAVQAEQLRQLDAWRTAITTLRSRSVDQCLRDRLVSERGWQVFDYREHHRPDRLIRVYDYGDTLHWPKKTPELEALEADEMLAACNRHSFFEAMAGLAHLYIGFGELVRGAIGTAPQAKP
jgi:hypothetical protein